MRRSHPLAYAFTALLLACAGEDGSAPDAEEVASYEPESDPITGAPGKEWTYIPVDGAVCRDGSPTGFLFNPNPASDKLFLFLEEGAACFNTFSCNVAFTFDANNPQQRIDKLEGSMGASNRASPSNPFAEYNLAFVPYCSGDVHAGNAEDVEVAGRTYQFQGYGNTTLIFDRLAATLPELSQLVLAGSSAGGWGVGLNYPKARAMFPTADVVMLDDSASYMGNQYLPPCIQQHWRTLWNFDSILPEDCDDCFSQPDGTFVEQMIVHVMKSYPDFRGGLLETVEDEQMRMMIGFAENDCASLTSTSPLPPAPYDAARFKEGLIDLRDRIVGPYPSFRVFYDVGNTHAFLSHTTYGALLAEFPPRFDAEVEGVKLTDWLQAAVDGGEWRSVSAF